MIRRRIYVQGGRRRGDRLAGRRARRVQRRRRRRHLRERQLPHRRLRRRGARGAVRADRRDRQLGRQAYFKHVNATGGILGHKVNYITLNNQSNAAQSELIAKKCVQTYHAQFIVGPESGADTESALPIAIANKTILISLSSGWQTNGYPASELNSWGFPGFYDVFAEDQIASVQNLIVPQALHQGRAARGQLRLGLPGQPGHRAGASPSKDGFQLVSTQIDQVGATDVTPQVLAMLAAKPQIILFGLVPGTDSITAIRAIRAQDPTIPISECSGCEMPSFVSAAGGADGDAEHLRARLHAELADPRPAGHLRARTKATAAGLRRTSPACRPRASATTTRSRTARKAGTPGSRSSWAIQQAGNLDETTIMQKLQHLDINTLGIVWTRNPSNYESYSDVDGRHGDHQPRRLGQSLHARELNRGVPNGCGCTPAPVRAHLGWPRRGYRAARPPPVLS